MQIQVTEINFSDLPKCVRLELLSDIVVNDLSCLIHRPEPFQHILSAACPERQ